MLHRVIFSSRIAVTSIMSMPSRGPTMGPVLSLAAEMLQPRCGTQRQEACKLRIGAIPAIFWPYRGLLMTRALFQQAKIQRRKYGTPRLGAALCTTIVIAIMSMLLRGHQIARVSPRVV